MNTTRTGKIARLPQHIRDQLNRRLHDGNQGKHLAAWLNTLPEVQLIMAADFAGKPIRPQNLSEWKHGGYRDWLLDQDAQLLARQLAQHHDGLQSPLPFADLLARSIAARYALATCVLPAQDTPEQWRRLRELCADVVQLRRGDHAAERLRLDRERLAQMSGAVLSCALTNLVRPLPEKYPATQNCSRLESLGCAKKEQGGTQSLTRPDNVPPTNVPTVALGATLLSNWGNLSP